MLSDENTFSQPYGRGSSTNIDLNVISEFKIPDIPLWEISKPTVNLEKSDTNPLEFNQKFAEIKHAFNTFNDIYTNGSKDKNKVASAAIHKKKTIQRTEMAGLL